MSRSLNSLLIAAGAVALLAAGGLAGGFGAAAAGLDAAEADGQDQPVDTQVRRRVVTRHRGWQADEDYGRIVTRLNRLIERAEQRAATADNPEEAAKYQQLVQTRQARLDQVESRRVRVNRVAEEPAGGESAGDDSGGTSREPRQDPNTVFYGPLAPSSEPEPQPEPEVDFPVLQPGPGWSGPTPQPPPVGSPDMPGYDAKAIARWDVVPFQTFEGEFHIGVVAFHMNGIDRVEFSVNDGPWESVYEMKLNPRTEVWEYTATLDSEVFHVEQVEVRAVVYPVVGEARVLGGEMVDGAASGEHSMFLALAPAEREVRWVAPWGDNETGDGSEGNPFATIKQAAMDINAAQGGKADHGLIYLNEGDYAFSGGWTGTSWHTPTTEWSWLTVAAAPGADPAKVRITEGGSGERLNVSRVHLRGLTLATGLVSSLDLNRPAAIWFDGCTLTSYDQVGNTMFAGPSMWTGGIYLTDSTIAETMNGPSSTLLVRNTDAIRIGSDPFQNARLLVNATVDGIDRGETAAHPDVWQLYSNGGVFENCILYGLVALGAQAQGIFNGGASAINNVAIVNVLIEKPGLAGDPLFSQWGVPTDHLLIWNFTSVQAFIWRTDALRNISIRDSVFARMGGTANLRPEWAQNNHFIETEPFGINATSGAPHFADVVNGDFRPALASPLLGRVASPPTPTDALGDAWETPGAVGALGPASTLSSAGD